MKFTIKTLTNKHLSTCALFKLDTEHLISVTRMIFSLFEKEEEYLKECLLEKMAVILQCSPSPGITPRMEAEKDEVSNIEEDVSEIILKKNVSILLKLLFQILTINRVMQEFVCWTNWRQILLWLPCKYEWEIFFLGNINNANLIFSENTFWKLAY